MRRLGEVDERVRWAAERCGADVDLWVAVHQTHGDRKAMTVAAGGSRWLGDVVAIDDAGFELATDGMVRRFTWRDSRLGIDPSERAA